MRALVLSALFPSLALAQATPPTDVAYALAGLVSGPYRVAADLAAGTVSEARPPRGALGDGARINPWTMPETARRALSPTAREEIARLAASVRRDGPSRDPLCPPTVDAIGTFRIAGPDGPWEATASTPCLSRDAAALLRALTRAVGNE